ncbi:MAG: hypothetical protein HOE48_14290 [Candidatus Latescibacteria bacterium]|jgi:hypothetical protein|nr:hypothetical protein [Candidatus Latescibacterota bacterium]MBT4139085.1 hypothetical protein [Candidatus Latescibacterota bacterium]MBT5830711.1 hypothetical protein [Candidatus Latescibacterota bacterium]
MINGLPLHLTLTFIATTLITLVFLFIALKIGSRPVHRAIYPIIIVWTIGQAILGGLGFYLDFDANPPRFLLAIGLPILLIIFVLIKYPRVLCGLPLRLLTFMHIIRIPVEIILFGLYQEGHIPRLMTYEGRNFDILAGMTGPLIALIAFRGGIQKQLLIFWNIIGLALLLNIVANAVLSTPLPFQQFAFERPNVAVFYFPFIWLPAVVVPAVFFAHLTSLLHLIRK